MAKYSIMRAATAFLMILWCSMTHAAPHQRRVHGSLRHSRSEPNVEPFLITVMTSHLGLNSTLPATSPKNISTYLVGESPNPANPSQFVGFVAQRSNGEATTYFSPPAHARAEVVKAAPATASWKAGSAGTRFKTPGIINSGRIYIVADGYLNFYASEDKKIIHPDPHNPTDIASQELWGFIELTHAKDPSNGNENMVVNLSFVDWVSLPLGMSLTSQGPNGTDTVTIGGLQPDGLVKVCEALSALPGFWPKLCIRSPANNTPLRVMSPEKYISIHSDDKDAISYYEPYINKAWEKYKNVDLKINTQVDGPNSNIKVDNGRIVTCRVGHDDILHCDNDAGDFARPVSRDIYGCDSGPFANPANGATESWSRARLRPRLCAAFVRSTIHLDGVQPSHDVGPDKYYQESVTNHYARVVHNNLIGGSGYAFSYDDVNPGSTENAAGLISVTHPLQLNIHVNI